MQKHCASTSHCGVQPKSVCPARSTWPAAVGIQRLLWELNASVCFQFTIGSCGTARGRAGRPREQQQTVWLQKHVGWVNNSWQPLQLLEWEHTDKNHVFTATYSKSKKLVWGREHPLMSTFILDSFLKNVPNSDLQRQKSCFHSPDYW